MEKTERLKATEALRARGATTDIDYYAARSELSDARERLHEAQAAVTQIQRKVSELQQEKTQLAVDAEIEREREIKDALNTIAEEEVTRATIGNFSDERRHIRRQAEHQGIRLHDRPPDALRIAAFVRE